ncbi:MAG: peptidyl-prolyl cis-trans isomerase [Proteobacteria bacterium]|nr:peptidyl-prolyl cis-trans isomerase [Pseudomonadota bacterium]
MQFIALGAALFLSSHYFSLDQTVRTSAYEIAVSDATLMRYAKTRTKRYSSDDAGRTFNDLPDHQKKALRDGFIRDEVLYREALALGLNDNDAVIRRRLIQKMEFIAQGFKAELPKLDETDLADYLQRHHEKYRVEAAASFTHVFIPAKKREDEAVLKRAHRELLKLNRLKVPFEDAGRFGHRFIYNRNYIERTKEFVRSHFGGGFQQALFSLRSGSKWQGPLQSDYGYHLVLLKKTTPTRLPKLKEVSRAVLADARRDQLEFMKKEAIAALVNKYTIRETIDNQ